MGVQESEEKFELLKDSPPQPGVKPLASTGSMGPPPLPVKPTAPTVQDKGKGKGRATVPAAQVEEGPTQSETEKDAEEVSVEEIQDKPPQAGDKRRRVSFAPHDGEKDQAASNGDEGVDVDK